MKKVKKKIELLAPVGGEEMLKAAVNNGADAIYMGMTAFNARQKAVNFMPEEFERAVDFAHDRGVSVYLTANTLVHETEMDDFLEMVLCAVNMGVDAIIVQDIGAAELIAAEFSGVPMHASTQMTISDLSGVKQAAASGFGRVVLARELSLEEIGIIANGSPIETEIFVHGALCYSFSGQCLMSDFIGGRSGNRGMCAQPCRLPYSLARKDKIIGNGYLLSPKDICAVDLLPGIVVSGVNSLKIEGRIKSSEYVAAAVSIYRKYIDKVYSDDSFNVDKADITGLMQVFNRGGKSQGRLKRASHRHLISSLKPKNHGIKIGEVISRKTDTLVGVLLTGEIDMGDGVEIWNGAEPSPGGIISYIADRGNLVKCGKPGQRLFIGDIKGTVKKGDYLYRTSSVRLNKELSSMTHCSGGLLSLTGENNHLIGEIEMKAGRLPVFRLKDHFGCGAEVTGLNTVQAARQKPLNMNEVAERLSKTGEYPYVIKEIKCDADNDVFLSVAEINALRRNALALFSHNRRMSFKRTFELRKDKKSCSPKLCPETGKSVLFYTREGYKRFISDCGDLMKSINRIYLPMYLFRNKGEINNLINAVEIDKIYPLIPVGVCQDKRGRIDGLMEYLAVAGIKGFVINSLGDMKYINNYSDVKFIGGQGFNIVNMKTAETLTNYGLHGITLSYEWNNRLNEEGIAGFAGFNAEIGVYGRLPVMHGAVCVVGGVTGCDEKTNENCPYEEETYLLTDRKGKNWPVITGVNGCGCIILSNAAVNKTDRIKEYLSMGINLHRYDFYDETAEVMRTVLFDG